MFDPTRLVITPETITDVATVQVQDKKVSFDFQVVNYPPAPIAKCECDYPYSEFRFIDASGDVALEGWVAQYMTQAGVAKSYPELTDLELLYIGQAYGEDGDRTAPQRLASHGTLQAILAAASRRSPDMDIWVVLFSFEDMLIASFDGLSSTHGTSEDEDSDHLWKVLRNRISEAQRINYCEAALIQYFQPEYNKTFKGTFPSAGHLSYSECYKLDLNSVAVEIECSGLGARLWSPSVPPHWAHLISFQLHTESERQNMFDFNFS